MNMPTIMSRPEWVDQVMDVVEGCLQDERVEVRTKAGQVLGGLLHCAFVNQERRDALLVRFCCKMLDGMNAQHFKQQSLYLAKCSTTWMVGILRENGISSNTVNASQL